MKYYAQFRSKTVREREEGQWGIGSSAEVEVTAECDERTLERFRTNLDRNDVNRNHLSFQL